MFFLPGALSKWRRRLLYPVPFTKILSCSSVWYLLSHPVDSRNARFVHPALSALLGRVNIPVTGTQLTA